MAKADPTTETVTVVFTDLVESTELTTRVGTERAEALVRTHLEALDDAIAHAGGRRVKRLGDGSMAVFPSASAALACAVAMQRATDAGRRRGAHPLRMRVGIGAGDVLVEDGDCSGAPVVEAARLCALADGGQILATELVGLLGGRRTSATVTALGPRELKGLPDPVDVVEVAWAAPDGASPRQRAGSGPLLERAGEVALLEGAFAEAREGRSSVVLVEGPAGTGKTRLLDTACDAAAGAGVLVLRARGTELERPYGWGVAHQLFERWLLAQGPTGRATLLRGPAEPARIALGAAADGGGDESFGAVHGLSWLVVHAAEATPLALVVDDAQWADEASLRWLAYLSARIDDLPLALVVATRDGHEPPREALLQLAGRPGALAVRPAPLSVAGTAELLAARAGLDADDLAQACHEATGGNPFLLHALIGDLAEIGRTRPPDPDAVRALRPQAISRSVLLRLGRLGPDAGAVARAVAVLGAAATTARTASVGGVDEAAVAAAASALVGVGLFDASAPLTYAHPLVHSIVLDDLPPLERAAAHRRAAAALDATGARPEEVASQLLRTEPAADDWAAGVLVRAGGLALDRGAPHAAAAFLARAAREPPGREREAEVQRLLGRALVRARGAPGLDALRAAVDLEPRAVPRAETALELARALEALSRNLDAVGVYDRALADLADADPALASTLRAGLAVAAAQHLSTVPRALEVVAQDASDAEMAGGGNAVLAALVALALTAAGSPDGVGLAATVVASGALLDAEPSIAIGLAVEPLVWGDRLDEALAAWDQVIARARRPGGGGGPRLAYALTYRAHVHLRAGRLAEAEGDVRAALAHADDLWVAAAVPVDLPAFLAQALVERGALEEAEGLLAGAGPARELSDYQGNNLLLLTRGRLRLAQARGPEAAEDLLELGRRCEAWTLRNPAALPWRSHAALALRTSDPDRAAELAAEEVALARGFGASRALGMALRALGLRDDGRRGDPGARGGRRRAGVLTRPPRARAGPGRPRRRRPPLRARRRRARAARGGPGPRDGVRRDRAGRRRPRRAARGRGAAPPRPRHRPRCADRQRAARRPPGRRRPHEPRDRRGALDHAQDGRDAPRPDLPQARRRGPRRPRRRARPGRRRLAARRCPPPRLGVGGETPGCPPRCSARPALGESSRPRTGAHRHASYRRPRRPCRRRRRARRDDRRALGRIGPSRAGAPAAPLAAPGRQGRRRAPGRRLRGRHPGLHGAPARRGRPGRRHGCRVVRPAVRPALALHRHVRPAARPAHGPAPAARPDRGLHAGDHGRDGPLRGRPRDGRRRPASRRRPLHLPRPGGRALSARVVTWAQAVPMSAPRTTSPGKCTPVWTRE